MTYTPTTEAREVVDGGETQSVVKDDDQRELLVNILKELRLLNAHISYISGLGFQKEDVENYG